MLIKVTRAFNVSLDDGLTVSTIPAGDKEVPQWVGELAVKHYGAKEIKKRTTKKKGN